MELTNVPSTASLPRCQYPITLLVQDNVRHTTATPDGQERTRLCQSGADSLSTVFFGDEPMVMATRIDGRKTRRRF
jgi:hypothetical protein